MAKNIDIPCYILAGGKSTRFGNQVKGLAMLNEIPLIEHAINRLKIQTNHIIINSHLADYQQFDLPLIADSIINDDLYQGPLHGLLACMTHHKQNYPEQPWLAICPSDAPFLPQNMLEQLSAESANHLAVSYQYEGYLQPTFSLWHCDLFDKLTTSIEQEHWAGLKIFFHSLENNVKVIDHPLCDINPFFNINTPSDLAVAEKLL